MLTKREFINTIQSPLPNAILKKYPEGNVMQFWAESPELYANSYKHYDEFHQKLYGHPGVDLVTFKGDSIKAPFSGKAILRDYPNGGGKTVYVYSETFDNEDGKTGYCIAALGHCDSFSVSDGQDVVVGQEVGKEGNTGFVVSGNVPYWNNAPANLGTHLHWSLVFMFSDGTPMYPNIMGNTVDPLPIVTDKDGLITSDTQLGGTNQFLLNALEYLKGRESKPNL